MSGDTREAIMDATFAALCKHGYADLTMQAIADEFEKSKSIIHYYYDSKDDLLTAFVQEMLEDFVGQVEECGGTDPADRLRKMAELVVAGPDDVGDARAFYTALLELRARAPHNDSLREQLVHNDRRIRQMIADAVRDGQERGAFDDSVDPASFAVCFRSTIEGAQSHDVILGDEAPTEAAIEATESLLVDRLLVDGEGRE